MKNYLLLFLSLCCMLLFTLPSCVDKKANLEQRQQLDSLQTALSQLNEAYDKLDPKEIRKVSKECKQALEKVYEQFQSDPLAIEGDFILSLESYKLSLSHLVTDVDNLEAEMQFALQQVSQWKIKLQQDSASPEDFKQYYPSQVEAIHSLQRIVSYKNKEWIILQKKWEAFEPDIKKISKKK